MIYNNTNRVLNKFSELIIRKLILSEDITEDYLQENFSALKKKYRISRLQRLNLIIIIEHTIYRINESIYLSSSDKERYREKLTMIISQLKNPYGKTSHEIEHILITTDGLKQLLKEEKVNKKNATQLIEIIEKSISSLRLPEKKGESTLVKTLFLFLNLSFWSLKILLYGITFNIILIVAYCLYNPEINISSIFKNFF